tara:strand:+ start:24431 stop:25927 length:1497 start_codon:yes stop_codon:yes gene_type:complete
MAGKNSVFVDNSAPSCDATWLNLNQNETNNIIESSGQTLSDAVDYQEATGVARYAACNFYTDSGSANTYILTPKGSFKSPVDGTIGYFDGMHIKYRPGNANTGASTINVNSAGVVSIKKQDGVTDPDEGDISADEDLELRYDSANTAWLIKPKEVAINQNAIINGDFNIWQRGTSFSSVANSTYSADRWGYYKSGVMVHDLTRSIDVPTVAQAGRLFNYSLLIDCTTIDSSIGASDLTMIRQPIEGYNFLPIAQKKFTISFWVKATKTGTYCCSFRNSGADRSYVAEYTINTTDTWEYKTITVSASPSTGTWNYTNGIGLYVEFNLATGSTYQTTANAWQTGTYFGTSNQVNACDNIANNFRICGIQLEAGSVATSFEQRPFQEELFLCKRYYRKSFPYSTAPAQNAGTGGMLVVAATGTTAGTASIDQRFDPELRSNPSITFYNPSAANALWRNLAGFDSNAGANQGLGTSGVSLYNNGTVSQGNLYGIHYTLDSEL